MKMKLLSITLILVLILLIVPASAAMTMTQAKEKALEYAKNDEWRDVSGPYSYQSKSYYYVEYGKSYNATGILVLDAETGDIIKDKNIAEKVAYTHYYLWNVTDKYITDTENAIDVYKLSAVVCRQKSDMFKSELPAYKDADRKKVEQSVNAYSEVAGLWDQKASVMEEMIPILKDITSGNKSYESAMIITKKIDEFEKTLNSISTAYDKISESTDIYCDVLIANSNLHAMTNQQVEDYRTATKTVLKQEKKQLITEQLNLIEAEKKEMDENITRDMKFMDARIEKAETPGFGIVVAVSALLIVGMFMRNRRK
ncbi:MAG: PGF-CTERM sorting domain-containing protein [Methanimicrococcus sp.]|nr:PGF-CTERM sorting domain-containing protein [Methanimicrococcus sp.]